MKRAWIDTDEIRNKKQNGKLKRCCLMIGV